MYGKLRKTIKLLNMKFRWNSQPFADVTNRTRLIYAADVTHGFVNTIPLQLYNGESTGKTEIPKRIYTVVTVARAIGREMTLAYQEIYTLTFLKQFRENCNASLDSNGQGPLII